MAGAPPFGTFEPGSTSVPGDDDMRELEAARHGDRATRGRLVERHLDLVRSVASRYRGLGLPFDDLLQEGSLGLLEAIDLYDPSRGTDFERYARFRVRRAITNALTAKSRVIRLPKQVVERRRAIERTEARLAAVKGRLPTSDELAAVLEIPESVVLETRGFSVAPVSLDQSVLPDGSTLEMVVADAASPDPAVETVDHEQVELVDAAVAELPERQREILSRHFGFGRDAEQMADVASALHLSQQRARAIERDALYALRERLSPLRTR
jgi:RNA polymerase sigma factor (sigma-70 family)